MSGFPKSFEACETVFPGNTREAGGQCGRKILPLAASIAGQMNPSI
jgi:hypothetical protein